MDHERAPETASGAVIEGRSQDVPKHTPGPWRHATRGNLGNCVEGPTGQIQYEGDDGYRTVCMVQGCTALRRFDDTERNKAANIALIAAAPDLLAALKGILDPDDANDPDLRPEWRAVVAAIAKAEGRS